MNRLKNFLLSGFLFLVLTSVFLSLPIWSELFLHHGRVIFHKIKNTDNDFYQLPGTYIYAPHPVLSVTLRDRYLFHGKTYSPMPEKGVIRIMALGGSTTYGHRVGDKAYPNELQRLLNASGIKAEVINGGIPAHGVEQILIHFISHLTEFNPDFLFLHIGNLVGKGNYNQNEVDVGSDWRHHFWTYTLPERKFRFWSRFSWVTKMFADESPKSSSYGGLEVDSDTYWGIEKNAELFRNKLEYLILIAKMHNITPILSLIPTMHGASEEEKKKLGLPVMSIENQADVLQRRTLTNNVISTVAKKHGVLVVETDAIKDDSRYFIDEQHQSVLGHRKQAKLIFDALKTNYPSKVFAKGKEKKKELL